MQYSVNEQILLTLCVLVNISCFCCLQKKELKHYCLANYSIDPFSGNDRFSGNEGGFQLVYYA